MNNKELKKELNRRITGNDIRVATSNALPTGEKITQKNYKEYVPVISEELLNACLKKYPQFRELDKKEAINVCSARVSGIVRYLVVRNRL